MSLEEQTKGDRENTTVELERNVGFCLYQVDRIIQHKGRNFQKNNHSEAYLLARCRLQYFMYAMLLNSLSELLNMPSLSLSHRWQNWDLQSLNDLPKFIHLDLRYESVLSNSHGRLTILHCFPRRSEIDPTLEGTFEQNFLKTKWIYFSWHWISHAPHSWIITQLIQ